MSEHEARLAAEAASQAKDRFLAVLSHELRTPLMPAFMTVAALESDMSLPLKVREALRNVRRNLELETKLIDDLLDLSRVMNDKLRLRRQPLSMHFLIERVAEMLNHDLIQKSLTLRLQLEAKDTVEGDSSRLQQVLWNLLSNAIKFSNPGGEIFVRSTNPNSHTLQVQVIDSGAGIDSAVMPKIFDAFEQGDAAMMRRQGGLGLGLSIAKPIIEAHGGAITPHSDGAGQGATFTITLPLCATSVLSGSESSDGDAAASTAPLRVLLVEDHSETARLLSRLLETSGHVVTIAGDVQSALRLAKENRFDVVVSDIGLPDGTGYDLMKRLREESPIPGVALTGYGMDEDLQKSTEAGFADHILKPVDAQQLETVLWRVARTRHGSN
jgi:CheY-like chemotaxis protein